MTRRPRPDLGPDFDGCATHPCRLTGVHSLVWGQCGQAPESARPEPTVSFLRVRDADDGYRDIVSESMTLPDLADRIERALRTVPIRLGPNALAILGRGEQVILSGGEYAAMALAVAADLAEDPVAIASLPDQTNSTGRSPASELLDDECPRCERDTAACLCVDTPGCDCGHDGLDLSWHRDDCNWKTAWRAAVRGRILQVTAADPDRWQAIRAGRRPTSLDLALIADAAGVTVDWLLAGRRPRLASGAPWDSLTDHPAPPAAGDIQQQETP